MGLNKLYFDHQLAVMREAGAAPLERLSFHIVAAQTAGKIGALQRSLGAPAAVGWEQLALLSVRERDSKHDPVERTGPGNLMARS